MQRLSASVSANVIQLKLSGMTEWAIAVQLKSSLIITNALATSLPMLLLYEGLIQLSPTLGALVSQTAAIVQARGFNQGLVQLDALLIEAVKNY